VKKDRKPRVKREFDAGGVIDLTEAQPRKKVKVEERKPPFISGEVIDLT
jgi:hypothetical protein